MAAARAGDAGGDHDGAVPNVLTYNEQQATDRLTESQLKTEVEHVNGDAKAADQVTKQTPVAGTQVEQNSTVIITVNDGPKTAKIPTGLVGDDVADAEAELKKKKFSNVTKKAAPAEPSDAGENEVLLVSPGEGTTIPLDQKITLTYATGKSKVPVLTGKTPAQAESDARAAGFTEFKRDEVETDAATAGVVFEQNPKPERPSPGTPRSATRSPYRRRTRCRLRRQSRPRHQRPVRPRQNKTRRQRQVKARRRTAADPTARRLGGDRGQLTELDA